MYQKKLHERKITKSMWEKNRGKAAKKNKWRKTVYVIELQSGHIVKIISVQILPIKINKYKKINKLLLSILCFMFTLPHISNVLSFFGCYFFKKCFDFIPIFSLHIVQYNIINHKCMNRGT